MLCILDLGFPKQKTKIGHKVKQVSSFDKDQREDPLLRPNLISGDRVGKTGRKGALGCQRGGLRARLTVSQTSLSVKG